MGILVELEDTTIGLPDGPDLEDAPGPCTF
jgi:hypothetical protein